MAAKTQLGWDRSLLRAGERVCVAVSGGADSTALLLALLEANVAKQPPGIVVSAAHVNHGLRGAESDADEAFVRELCGRLGVPLKVFAVDTTARQVAEREGLEEAARALRYEALRSLLDAGAADVIATAHTLDDQAETVVMKLLRGAWTEGLGGIAPVLERGTPISKQQVLPLRQAQGQDDNVILGRILGKDDNIILGRVVRPLLGVRRREVETFLNARSQPWRDDSSNLDLALTRNRVRHQLMPVLREFNPSVDDLFARTAEIARDEEAYWQAEVARLLPQVLLPGKPVRGGGRAVSTAVGEKSCAVEIARLAALPAALRRRVVRAVVRTVGTRLSADETARVLALAGLGTVAGAAITGRTGSRLELRDGLRVERSARELRFWHQTA